MNIHIYVKLQYLVFKNQISRIIMILMLTITGLSCKKFVSVDPPSNRITGASAFSSDATAASVLTNLYIKLSQSATVTSISPTSLYYYGGLSGDELLLWSGATDNKLIAYYKNNLTATSPQSFGSEAWDYTSIFTCNSAIEGINNSTSLTPAVKQQLLGEAKFMRAYYYFYLTNLFGSIPLVLSPDYEINTTITKSSQTKVYEQIISDLKDAKSLLSDNFLKADLINSTNDRVRPTKWAAMALLARVYLYTSNWPEAETEASGIISNSSFSLIQPNSVFLKNSKESIWQLQPVNTNFNTEPARGLIMPSTGPNGSVPGYLSPVLLGAFEKGDKRRLIGTWIDSVNVGGIPYLFVCKYKANLNNPNITSATGTANMTEYLMVLRLAEQYLIRAEARARQSKFQSAIDDVNMVRLQHGGFSTPLAPPTSIASAMSIISHERQVELFVESGDRWINLKRTGEIDAAMTSSAGIKGIIWSSFKSLYPLPLTDIQKNPNLVQNQGY